MSFRIELRFDALFGAERPADPMFMNQFAQNYRVLAEFAVSIR